MYPSQTSSQFLARRSSSVLCSVALCFTKKCQKAGSCRMLRRNKLTSFIAKETPDKHWGRTRHHGRETQQNDCKALFARPQCQRQNPMRGPKHKLTAEDKRCLMREASNSSFSSKQLKLSLNLPISSSQTRVYLNRSANMRFLRLKSKPSLSDAHLKTT